MTEEQNARDTNDVQLSVGDESAALAPELYEKPAPNRLKSVLFNTSVVVTTALNLAGAVLGYSIFSSGEILSDFYNKLAAAELSTYVWVAAGIALACGVLTVLSYVLSLDYRRDRRPVKRLHLLLSSLLLFGAGIGLGTLEVEADTVWAFLAAAVLAFALAGLLHLVERAIGSAFGSSAEKLLRANAPVAARATARAALRLKPSDRHIEQVYGLAMTKSGRALEALPYLVASSSEIATQPASIVGALADIYEANGRGSLAVAALERLYREQPSPSVFKRLMNGWLAVGRRDEVLRELQALPPDQRQAWHETLRELVFERGDLDSKRSFCREIELSEGPPYQKAQRCYFQLLEVHPDDQAALRSLVDLARRRGDSEQAAQFLERLLETDDSGSANDRRDLIAYYWSKGDRANTLRHLNRIHLSGEATLEEKLRILDEHFAEGDYASVEELVRGDEALSGNARALTTLAHALWQGNRLDESLETIKQVRQHDPDADLQKNVDALEKSVRARKLAIGLEELSQRVRENPEDLDLRFEYYDKLVPGGKADRVVLELEELLTKKPEHRPRVEREIRWLLTRHGRNFRLLDYLGDLYLRDGDVDRAFELYEERAQGELHSEALLHESSLKILQRDPAHKPALLAEVRHFFNQGDSAEALAYIDRYYDAGGEANAGLQQLEYNAAVAAGHLERALSVGKSLLEQNPEDAVLLSRLAEMATELRQFDEAAAFMKRAQELDPENHLYRRQIRASEEKRKRYRIEEIRSLIERGEDSDDLHEELGDLYYDFGQLNEAMAEYQRSSQGSPERRVARAKLGFVLSRKGMHLEAEETLLEVDMRPDIPAEELKKLKALFYSAAELMEEDGEDERALALFRRVFRVDAAFKDVVGHVERLQHSDKKKKRN